MDHFEKILWNAYQECSNIFVEEIAKNFQLLYPFTTENIAGYIPAFALKDRSLLTVGSSGDQIINANLWGCNDITCFDICPFTKLYTYLKISCLLTLEKKQFLNFFCSRGKKTAFQKEVYKQIKQTLRILDYESYLFWDELFANFEGPIIRQKLFYFDQNKRNVIEQCNPYLQSEKAYLEARQKIKKATIEFIIGDLFKTSLDKQFDTIWLSNIGTYLSRHFVKIMVDKMSPNIKDNGKLLISYLYEVTANTKYQSDWCLIYDLEKTFAILQEYHPELYSFIGIRGLETNDSNKQDSVLIYQKE